MITATSPDRTESMRSPARACEMFPAFLEIWLFLVRVTITPFG